jgi:hypothetical protein
MKAAVFGCYAGLPSWAELDRMFYVNAALDQLRAQGYLVLDEDVARLSPFAREHLDVVGNYTFSLPDLGEAGIRPLRDPDAQTMTTAERRN